jgi:hypothetical protein
LGAALSGTIPHEAVIDGEIVYVGPAPKAESFFSLEGAFRMLDAALAGIELNNYIFILFP